MSLARRALILGESGTGKSVKNSAGNDTLPAFSRMLRVLACTITRVIVVGIETAILEHA